MSYQRVGVVIPTIPPRRSLFKRAMQSVQAQTRPVDGYFISVDAQREGAWANRQRALSGVPAGFDWVAFLDDDDEFKPQHVQRMLEHAEETGADFVYSWFEVIGGTDPFPPTHFTNDFDPNDPIETTITVLVRRELAQQVGFQRLNRGETNSGEDRFFTLGCLEAGAKISHLKEKTWYWHHDSNNTSGLPSRW